MTLPTLHKIQQFQSEYHHFIVQFENRFKTKDLTWRQIAAFIDDVKYFWLERLDIIELELENLTDHHTCFLLSGAIYLNVSDNEHFYFKSLGEYHILSDSFLKLDNFFRVPEDAVDKIAIRELFGRVLQDTLKILENYQKAFYILPIRELAIEDESRHYELLEQFFIRFLSSAFGKQFEDQNEFCDTFKTFEEIENHLIPYLREKLIFDSRADKGLSLREKIELHNKSQSSYSQLLVDQPDARIFLVTLYSYLSQISDVLLTCTILRVNPYIRSETTFHYLLLVMYTFIEDRKLKDLIEKAIIFYIFRKTIDVDSIEQLSFDDYVEQLGDTNLLSNIANQMNTQKMDIFRGGVSELAMIIETEFSKIIDKNNI